MEVRQILCLLLYSCQRLLLSEIMWEWETSQPKPLKLNVLQWYLSDICYNPARCLAVGYWEFARAIQWKSRSKRASVSHGFTMPLQSVSSAKVQSNWWIQILESKLCCITTSLIKKLWAIRTFDFRLKRKDIPGDNSDSALSSTRPF